MLFGFLIAMFQLSAGIALAEVSIMPATSGKNEAIGASASSAASSRFILRFEKVIEVMENAKFSLLDIAIVESASKEQLDQIRQIDVTDIVAKNATLTPAEILPQIKRRLEDKQLSAAFVFNNFVAFKKKTEFSIKHFSRLLVPYLKTECGNCNVDITAENLRWHLKTWEVAEFPANLQSSLAVPLKIADSQSFRWVSLKVKAWKDIPVLIKPLTHNEIITADNLTSKQVDLAIRKGLVTERDQLIGHRLQGSVSAQSPIEFSKIAKEYLVKRGQKVKTVLGNDSFEVSTTTEAQQDGVKGDIIRVRQADNKKDLQAKVIEAGIVRID